MGKRKLNYRFHNPNPPEALGRELLQICLSADMGKVESAVRESVEKASTLRVVAINRNAQVAKLKDNTLFRMPIGEYEGKYYRISNECIMESSGEIVLELPSDIEIKLLDEMQQESKNLSIDEFAKAVTERSESYYREKYRRPSAVYAEQIKNGSTRQTSNQFMK